jgi:predicted 3-demethylubiquinone-9 3-methyltransferase (glyoxalase superfamily)
MIELLNDSDRDRARRAQEAMMKMVKLDIAEIKRAANESS